MAISLSLHKQLPHNQKHPYTAISLSLHKHINIDNTYLYVCVDLNVNIVLFLLASSPQTAEEHLRRDRDAISVATCPQPDHVTRDNTKFYGYSGTLIVIQRIEADIMQINTIRTGDLFGAGCVATQCPSKSFAKRGVDNVDIHAGVFGCAPTGFTKESCCVALIYQ